MKATIIFLVTTILFFSSCSFEKSKQNEIDITNVNVLETVVVSDQNYEVKIFHFDRDLSERIIKRIMKKAGFKPATEKQLNGFLQQLKSLPEKAKIMALGGANDFGFGKWRNHYYSGTSGYGYYCTWGSDCKLPKEFYFIAVSVKKNN